MKQKKAAHAAEVAADQAAAKQAADEQVATEQAAAEQAAADRANPKTIATTGLSSSRPARFSYKKNRKKYKKIR